MERRTCLLPVSSVRVVQSDGPLGWRRRRTAPPHRGTSMQRWEDVEEGQSTPLARADAESPGAPAHRARPVAPYTVRQSQRQYRTLRSQARSTLTQGPLSPSPILRQTRAHRFPGLHECHKNRGGTDYLNAHRFQHLALSFSIIDNDFAPYHQSPEGSSQIKPRRELGNHIPPQFQSTCPVPANIRVSYRLVC